jgi:predicted NAD-dependent protein-ADP-ribosyltransferase YbiA (DUF1768 family)/uncharacterized protein YigA (DUF484 family)
MADNKPLLDQLALQEQFGGYTPQELPQASPSIPFQGLDMSMPSPSQGEKTPAPSSLSALENSLLSIRDDDKQKGGSILRTVQDVSSDRYPNFMPGNYNNEDAYAQGQGWTSKMVNGVGKGLLLTGTTFLQSTVGLVNGLARAASDGRAASFYDNDLNRWVDDINNKANNYAPNYYKDVETNAAWYSPKKLLTANFLWEGIVKNMGFMAGAALAGNVFAAGIGAASKALATLPKAGKLFSLGKAAETLAATEEGLLAADKAAETYGKVKSLSDKFLNQYNILNPGSRALVAGLSTTGEAGFEAFQNLNQFRTEKINEYRNAHGGLDPMGEALAKINESADAVGNASFLANVGLLSATNYIQFPKILGSSYRAEKGIVNDVVKGIGEITEQEGKYVSKASMQSKGILSTLNKVRPYTFSASEGFEEGAQYAIQTGTQDYYNKKYNNKDTDFMDSIGVGIQQTLGTNEGMSNVLMGGLSGALMMGRGRYREGKALRENTEAAVNQFNKYRLSDFTKDTIDSVNRGTALQEERETLLKEGNITDSKDVEHDYIINYLAPRIKYGRYDLVKSEIEDYRRLAMTDEGFFQLQAEGKALNTDKKEAYLERLNKFEQTAENTKSLYQSLHLRYGGMVDKDNAPIYSPEVMDKLVYASSKISDYDDRIPSLTPGLMNAGIDNINDIIDDLLKGDDKSYTKAMAKLTGLSKTTKGSNKTVLPEEVISLKEHLEDVAKMSLRRNTFLEEYNDIKQNPKDYQTRVLQVEEEEVPQVDENGNLIPKQTISIKTKKGDRDIEIGTEYYLGNVNYDDKGNKIHGFVKFTVLKDSGDGKILVRDSYGEREVDKSAFANYHVGKVSSARANDKASFFMDHANIVYNFNFGKDKKTGEPKVQPGRLEYSPEDDVLLFNFVDKNNKPILGKNKKQKSIEVTMDQFKAKAGFKQAQIFTKEKLTGDQTKSATKATSKPDPRLAAKREVRLKIFNDLYDELSEKHIKINNLLITKKEEIKRINSGLELLQEDIESGTTLDKRSKGISFTKLGQKYITAALRLSRSKEQLENEVNDLEAQNDQIEFTISYLMDAVDNIDLLPTNTEDLLDELKDQLDVLNDLSKETTIQISNIYKLIDELTKSIDNTIDTVLDFIDEFNKDHYNLSIDFLKANPEFLKSAPNLKDDIQALEDVISLAEDVEIPANKKKLEDLRAQLVELEKLLTDTQKQATATDVVYSRFKDIVDKYKEEKKEQEEIKAKSDLIETHLGSSNSGIQNVKFDEKYGPEYKKDPLILPFATTTTGTKPHAVRSNTFGANLGSFKNRKDIRGVYVTSKTEKKLIPGLIDHLISEMEPEDRVDYKREEFIVMVMVNTDGNLLDVNGEVIPEKQDDETDDQYTKRIVNAAIYQPLPLNELEWKTDGKKNRKKESMIREGLSPKHEAAIKEFHKKRRADILSSDTLSVPHEIEASFGIPQLVKVKDEEGNDVKVYTTRTSVVDAGLVTTAQLETNPDVIVIPTTNDKYDKNGVTYNTPKGRTFIETPTGIVKLNNRKFTPTEAKNVYHAILNLSREMVKGELDSDLSAQLFNYLRSIVYWGIPRDQQGVEKESAGYNSIYWKKDKSTGEYLLYISGKGSNIKFSPRSLERHKNDVITLIEGLYNNANSSMIKDISKEYDEVLEVAEDGKMTYGPTWTNYQSFQVSGVTPNGKKRSGEEIPLTTNMRPKEDADDVNREGIYFYTTDDSDTLVLTKPVKVATVTPTKTQAPSSTEAATEPVAKEDTGPKPYTLNGKFDNNFETPNKTVLIFRGNNKLLEPGLTDEEIAEALSVKPDDTYKGTLVTLAAIPEDQRDNFIRRRIYNDIQEKFEIKAPVQSAGRIKVATLLEPVVTEAIEEVPGDIADDVLDILSEDVDDDTYIPERDRLVSNQDMDDVTKEDWNKVETWLKANFPNIPIYRLKNIIRSANGKYAWGMFQRNAVYLFQNAEVGTIYHEVFHAIWNMTTDKKEREAIENEFKNRTGTFFDRTSGKDIKYSDATPLEIEERLAEEFRDYVHDGIIPPKPKDGRPFIVKLFSDLVNLIKKFFTGADAQSNTEELFSKINTGYYKTYTPKNVSNAYSKVGIIDEDDAFADRDAKLSAVLINDKQRGDIIQEMTFQTLLDLVKTDKGLFEIDKINKQELSAKLKGQILRTINITNQRARLDVQNKMKTKEQVAPTIATTVNLMNNVSKSWDSIVEKFEEYIKGYAIEFDENDQLQLRNEDKIKEGDWVDATRIDYFKKTNIAIKLLLATLPKTDANGENVLSSINGVTLLPISQTYISIMNNLHNATSVKDMMEKLQTMAKEDSNYRSIYKRITKAAWDTEGVDLSGIKTKHSATLLSSFFNTFNKANPTVKNVFILDNGEVVVGDANLSTAATQLRSDYMNGIILSAKAGKGFFKYNEKEKAYVGNPTAVANINLDSPEARVSFLKKLGIDFSVAEIKKLERTNNEAYKLFRDATNGLAESIRKAEKLVTVSSKTLEINKRLLQLGLIKATIDNPEFDSVFYNINGDSTQSFIGVNPANNLYNFLSQLSSFDEDTLADTSYRYLKFDVFSANSNVLKRMFGSDGSPKPAAKELLKTGYISGTDNQQKGKQKSSSKLTYRERLIQELNINLTGWYLNLVPGDSSMEHMINLGNALDLNDISKGMDKIIPIFRGYFIDEINLLRENREVAPGRVASELRFFKDILGKELQDKLIANKDISAEELYENNKSQIDNAIEKFLNKETKNFETILKQYGILSEDETGWTFDNVDIPNGISDNVKDRYLKMLTANYMINNIELHKIIYSDPYQYADELKRIKNFNSPRQAIISNSPEMNQIFNNVWNEGYEKGDIGYTKFTQDYFRSATHEDIWGISKLDGYKPYEESDGSGIIIMKSYRQFRIRASNWNDAEERQYRYDIAWEKNHKGQGLTEKEINDKGLALTYEEATLLNQGNPGVKSAYTPLKPIVSGGRLNKEGTPNDINDIVLDKFALYPLSYRIMMELNSESNSVALYDKLQKENVDYMVFQSARKVGARSPHKSYTKDGKFNNDPYTKNNIINVPFSIMSVQTDVPSKGDESGITRGSQITKLVTMDFMEAGIPVDFDITTADGAPITDFTERYKAWYAIKDEEGRETASPLYKEIKHNQALLEARMEQGYQSLLRRLGITETIENGKKEYSIDDNSDVVRTLRDEMLKREVNDNISAALESFLNGKSILEATPAYRQVRNILYSIADKEIASQNVNGGMKVQIPVSFFESEKIKGVQFKAKDGTTKTGYVSDTLSFYPKDGKQVCEIMLGRWFKSNKSDEELLNYLNNTDEGQKILSGLAFRIPTQKQNSIDSFVIKKFLPKEFGDSVVIPSALVQKAGSDFDIDKLSLYLKNVKVGKDGYPKLIDYLTDENSTPEQRYYDWTVSNANIDATKYIKFLAKGEIKKIKDAFQEEFDRISNEYDRLVSKAETSHYDQLLESYNKTYKTILTSQDGEMTELFAQGSNWFNLLSSDIIEKFLLYKKRMADANVNGPDEIRNYLRLAQSFLTTYELNDKDITSLTNMSSLYEQELRILGATSEQVAEAKKDILQEFRTNKKANIDNIKELTSEMSYQTADSKDAAISEYKLDYANELAWASDLMSFDAFKKQSTLLQNTKKALDNEYIQSLQNLVSHPSNRDRLLTPNSAKELNDIAIEIAKATVGESFNYKNVSNMLNRGFMSRLRHAFILGKSGIGIAAVNQTNHSLNQRQPIYIDKSRLNKLSKEDAVWIGDGNIKFDKYNTIEIDGKMVPTLSMIKNVDGKDISNIISQFIDGYVDISKDPWIIELGATPNVASTWLFLVKLGIPVDTVAYFMNQPAIREYLSMVDNAGYSWLFIDTYVNDMLSSEKFGITDPEAILGVKSIPSKAKLRENLTKSTFTQQEKVEQQFMLREFLKYAKMAGQLYNVTQGSNFDTANFNDPYLIFKKIIQLEKAQNSIINSVDDLLGNSFVGKLAEHIQQMREALATILMSDQPLVRNVIQKVIMPYVDTNDGDFIKLSQKAVCDLFDFAVQTSSAEQYNTMIKKIMIDNGGVATELLNFINEVKTTPNHPLANNHVINVIEALPSRVAKEGGVNNIKIKGRDSKVYDQNNIIHAFRELRDYLGEDNSLYTRIKTLAVLQSGLSSSTISFTSLLPFEDFEDIYNDTLSKLTTVNLDTFYNLGVFERNNWNNDDITPYIKAKLITSKKSGDKFYNPPMEFLPLKVKNQVASGNIPQVMQMSQNNREANSKYIVYSWEKQNELLPKDWKTKYPKMASWEVVKEIKREMRRAGDYSYINKGLFQKVMDSSGEPLETSYIQDTEAGKVIVKQFVYKAINAWGDGQKANEFYDVDKKSVIDNGFIKVDGVDDNKIIDIFTNTKTEVAPVAKATPQAVSAPIKIDTSKKINIYAGTGENAELSNFAIRPFTIGGDEYKSVEQYFQYQKWNYLKEDIDKNVFDLNAKVANAIMRTTDGGMLRRFGKKFLALDKETWDNNSSKEMKVALKASFEQNSDALAKLLATGNATLTHTQESPKSKWREEFPRLLMEVRNELRPTQAGNGTMKLRDGKTYSINDINVDMLEDMGYGPNEIGYTLTKIRKEIC